MTAVVWAGATVAVSFACGSNGRPSSNGAGGGSAVGGAGQNAGGGGVATGRAGSGGSAGVGGGTAGANGTGGGSSAPLLTGVLAVDGGDDMTCALMMDRTVECWGYGVDG